MAQGKRPSPHEDIAIIVAELTPGKFSVGFRLGQENSLRVFAENLPLEAAAQLKQAITDRAITVEELAARGWRFLSLPGDLEPTLQEVPRGARWRRTRSPSWGSQFTPPARKRLPDGLHILRPDGKADPSDATIRHDWRAWAKQNGYRQATSVPVTHETQRIILEVWQGGPPNPYLLYHPLIPGTSDTEALYFLPDRESTEQFLQQAHRLAKAALETGAAQEASMDEQITQPNESRMKARATR